MLGTGGHGLVGPRNKSSRLERWFDHGQPAVIQLEVEEFLSLGFPVP